MKKDNVVLDKAFKFSVRIYKLHKYLMSEKHEYILARQMLRSGTSIGANLEEAMGAQSTKDFIAKLSVSYREARETSYWLRLVHRVELIETAHFESIHNDCHELMSLLSSILVTTKSKQKPQ